MGPIELQLYRELAVEIVRASVSYLRAQDDEPYDLDLHRAWFDQVYEEWASTPRSELAGRTPAEAIREERARRGHRGALDPARTTQMEFYTDLPRPGAQNLDDENGDESLLPVEAEMPDGDAPLSAEEQARWDGFRERYLRGWLDDLLPE